ncbi:MAG TPA: hypothetical protein VEN82_05355, partial [Actinomycetota bacterium]|nr:hypothetical protein [Actinomycetota bacterium]
MRIGLRVWLGLLFAGATALGTWFLLGPSLGPDARLGYYRPVHGVFTFGYDRAMLVLFVPFALALLAWRRGARIRLAWLVGGAVFLHLLLLFPPLPQSQDLYQYLFYGRMQAVYHANPYLVHPSALWHDAWYPWVRWPSQTTVYGPVWTLLSFGVAKVAGSSHTLAYLYLKVVVLAMDLAVMRLVVTVAREHGGEGAAGFGLLAYAWNPLILITVPLGGLADVALAAGILGAMLARRRGRPALATVLLAL